MNEPAVLDIRVLGGLEIRYGNRKLAFPTRHSALLLAVLALSPSGQVDREVCASLMWGERGDEQARASLRQSVYHAQKVLAACGAPALVANRRMVGLPPGGWHLDITTLLETCQSDPATAASLCRGEFLAGLGRIDPAFEDWVRNESATVTAQLQAALRPVALAALETGRFAELEGTASALLRLDRFDEHALRFSMMALARQNRRPAALKAFNAFEIALHAELGISAEAETLALRDQLKEQPAASAPPQTSTQEELQTDPSGLSERRAVSLLLLRPPEPISDPEKSARWLEQLTVRLTQSFEDTQVIVMQPVGAAVACIFGGQAPLERHSEDAALAALNLGSEAVGPVRISVVCGDIVHNPAKALSPADVGSIAHLVEEASALSDATQPEQPVVSRAVALRLGMETGPSSAGILLSKDRLAGETAHSARFVARETELAELRDALDACQSGNGRIVSLVGEAGIGKSSLVRAFAWSADVPRLVMEARARDANQPFAALSRLYRNWLDLSRGEAPEKVIHRTSACRHLPAATIPALRDILGLAAVDAGWKEAPPGLRRRRICELVVATLVEITRKGPAILVAEDLHWMDPETLSLLDQVVDELPALPVLVIATYRPEYQSNWIGRSFFRFIRLAPLSSSDSHNLLDSIVADK
ncbi:MAG: AAA family ATPase, partial [Pseudomonadota bacterium]